MSEDALRIGNVFDDETADMLATMKANHEREQVIYDTLDPTLPFLTRVVMATDIRAAQDALALVREGKITPPEKATVFAGSYSRIGLLADLLDEGFITEDTALDFLPALWPGADPDDTDRRFIDLWALAFQRNGRRPVYDQPGHPLPRRKMITVWRGQREGDTLGCAWSTSREIAEKFARGASFRTPIPNGEVIEATVPRSVIYAYLTSRNEAEVILDPARLARVR